MGQGVKGSRYSKLGALALAGALLLSACGGSGSSVAQAPEASSASPVSQPASSSSLVASSVLQQDSQPVGDPAIRDAVMALAYSWGAEGEGWRGVLEPYLDYAVVEPLRTSSTFNSLPQYINVQKNELYGTLNFAGETIFPLYEGSAIFSCGAHAHGGPLGFDVIAYDDPEYIAFMEGSGFPLDFYGGHGGAGPNNFLTYFPASDEYAVSIVSDGLYYSFEAEDFERLPDTVIYTVAHDDAKLDSSSGYLDAYAVYSVYPDHKYLYGIMDTTDFSVLLPNKYNDYFEIDNGFYALEYNDTWAYFSVSEQRMITDRIYESDIWEESYQIGFFNEGYCPVMRDGKYGFIDIQGNEVVPPQFDGATHVFGGRAWVKQNGLWGMIEIVA